MPMLKPQAIFSPVLASTSSCIPEEVAIIRQVQVRLPSSFEAVIVALPLFSAVALPFLSTLTVPGAELEYVSSGSSAPSGDTTTSSVTLLPMPRVYSSVVNIIPSGATSVSDVAGVSAVSGASVVVSGASVVVSAASVVVSEPDSSPGGSSSPSAFALAANVSDAATAAIINTAAKRAEVNLFSFVIIVVPLIGIVVFDVK